MARTEDRVGEIFDRAVELPPSDRRAYLAEACGEDRALRREVERLLAAHDRADGILDREPPMLLAREDPDVAARVASALADRYVPEDELGRGGMATVFLAHEQKHARKVVLKVMHPWAAELLGAERFLQEVHIAAQLAHPHILALIDSGEADGLLYYVMPYVGGEPLRRRLRREGAMESGEAVVLLRDIADALAHAHAAGIVHRDLKPENVLCVGGHAYLLDFGIAKLLPMAGPVADRLTFAGLPIGTPGYMAPEQASAGAVGDRADVWAWGVLAAEMLSGVGPPPEPGPAFGDAAARLLDGRAPSTVVDLVGRCLAADPAARPASVEILRALEDVVTPLPAEAAAHDRPRASAPARRWPWIAGAAAALLALGTVIAVSRSPAPDGGLPAPIAVAALTNETGDSSLATWGRLAGDWLTQGLQEAGLVAVVPWPSALQASDWVAAERAAGRSADPVALLRQETGAGTVVTGAYYLVGDSLRFQLELTDARSGILLAALPPQTAVREDPEPAIRALRSRLMGTVAVRLDERLVELPGVTQRPPTFDAYRAFDRGMSLYLSQDYGGATVAFRDAYARDTAFAAALLYAASAHLNRAQHAAVDSLLGQLRPRRAELGRHDELQLRYLDAVLVGDGPAALRAIEEAAAIAPASRASYNLALTALQLGRPTQALAALDRLNPDRGTMRGWSSYWTQRTHALHLLGRHPEERAAAQELRRRFPDRRVGLALEVRALAAAGQTAAIDSLLDDSRALPPDTYWSQGAAMVVAGEELLAHGHSGLADRYLERAVAWLANQLVRDPQNARHRYWIGSALYDLRRWADAAPYFASLVEDQPAEVDNRGLVAMVHARQGDPDGAIRRLGPAPAYDRGQHTAYRARLAAVAGDTDRALSLLSEALAQGVDAFPWLHATAHHDLAPLAEDPRYRQLFGVRP